MQQILRSLFGLILSLFATFSMASDKGCQIDIVVQNEKITYSINDTITVLVKVRLDDDFCDEAGNVTKVFSKGLKIVERSEWKKFSKNTLGQRLVLTVLKKKGDKTLTAYRKTAHYNCFQQKSFKTGP